MTDRELMQQALEALNHVNVQDRVQIIIALRKRLAQLEMQPCDGRNCSSTNPNLHSAECFEDYEKATGMVAQQPGIEELEHENRLMRARNERLKAEVDRLERENFAWRTKLGVRGYEMQIEDLRAKLQGLLHYRSKP